MAGPSPLEGQALDWLRANTWIFAAPVLVAALVAWIRFLHHHAHAEHHRRARDWVEASEKAGVKAWSRVTHSHRTPEGEHLEVVFAPGEHAGDIEKKTGALASALGAREVRVTARPDNARRARVEVVRSDTLAVSLPSPLAGGGATRRLYEGIRLGRQANGKEVEVYLFEANMLIAGEPGAGKSVLISSCIAPAALDPTIDLHLFDGKAGVEFAVWEKVAKTFVEMDLSAAVGALMSLSRAMERRYHELRRSRTRKVDPRTTRLQLIVIDELATYIGGERKSKMQQAFIDALTNLVRLGRAAGFIVISATQLPYADVVPSTLRNLFAYRCALRCPTPQASDVCLGPGRAANGYDASKVAFDHPGEGWLLSEEAQPVRFRAYYLSDGDLAELADRALEARGGPVPQEAGETVDAERALVEMLARDTERDEGVSGEETLWEESGSGIGAPMNASQVVGATNSATVWGLVHGRLSNRDREVLAALVAGERLTASDLLGRFFGKGSRNGASECLRRLEAESMVSKARREPLLGARSPFVYGATPTGVAYLESLERRS